MMYLISYDISNPKRLRSVAKKLENFGLRIQKSFFQCEMSEATKTALVADILSVLDLKNDSLIVTPICNSCVSQIIPSGRGKFFEMELYQIL